MEDAGEDKNEPEAASRGETVTVAGSVPDETLTLAGAGSVPDETLSVPERPLTLSVTFQEDTVALTLTLPEAEKPKPETCIVNLQPVLSNTSVTSRNSNPPSQSASRRFLSRFSGWRVGPAPVDTQPVSGEKIGCQELQVYTAPFFTVTALGATNNNNNCNAVAGPCPVHDSGSSPDPDPEAPDEPVSDQAPNEPRRTGSYDSYEEVCRICHDTPSKMHFITPCLCKGSMGLVHRECLERWLGESLKTSCEICGYTYVTTRQPRYSGCSGFCAWLRSPVTQTDTRNLFFDIACFFILTPLAVISSWLCVLGARHYTIMGQEIPTPTPTAGSQIMGRGPKPHRYRGDDASNSTWTSVGLLTLTGTLLAAYYVWLFVAVKYHYQIWKDWQQRNYIVTVLPMEPGAADTAAAAAEPGTVALDQAVGVGVSRYSRHRKSQSETINMMAFEEEEGVLGSKNVSCCHSPRPGPSRANNNFQHSSDSQSDTHSPDSEVSRTSSSSSTSSAGGDTSESGPDPEVTTEPKFVEKRQ